VARASAAPPRQPGVEELGRLPEVARVSWRKRASDRSLNRAGRLWTLTTVAHTVPFIVGAAVLTVLLPVTAPVALVLIFHAWWIPELYAARGASSLRVRGARDGHAEQVAVGLLGDLLDHRRRDLHERTRLVLEHGELGVWLLAESGAVLVRPGGRRANCYCVKVSDAGLPSSDRVAHLLLALRTDEAGFATVANLVFSGAGWRLRRRLPAAARQMLDVAVADARLR
jgi:hypothetical protein